MQNETWLSGLQTLLWIWCSMLKFTMILNMTYTVHHKINLSGSACWTEWKHLWASHNWSQLQFEIRQIYEVWCFFSYLECWNKARLPPWFWSISHRVCTVPTWINEEMIHGTSIIFKQKEIVYLPWGPKSKQAGLLRVFGYFFQRVQKSGRQRKALITKCKP